MGKSVKIALLLFSGILAFLAFGCSTVRSSDQRAAVTRTDGRVAYLGPQSVQQTSGYYASHCDEQSRQMQHELANCTAVPLVNIPAEPASHS
jgi:hypothetical protein